MKSFRQTEIAGLRERFYKNGYHVLGVMNNCGFWELHIRQASLECAGYTIKRLADGSPFLAYKGEYK